LNTGMITETMGSMILLGESILVDEID